MKDDLGLLICVRHFSEPMIPGLLSGQARSTEVHVPRRGEYLLEAAYWSCATVSDAGGQKRESRRKLNI